MLSHGPYLLSPRLVLGCLASLLLLLATASVRADDTPLTYDRVSLAASAELEVPNDLLTGMLYLQREGGDAAQLARQVNEAMDWALGQARQVPKVKARTLDYRTTPLYAKQVLTGWRVRQSLRLESRDPAAFSELLGRLQARLMLDAIGYQLSPERQQEAENGLIAEALAAFEGRAQAITRQLRRPDYRLVNLDVNASGVGPPPLMARAAPMAMAAADMAPPPVLEAGTQTVRVMVTGTIELKLP